MIAASYWKVPFAWTENTAPTEDTLEEGVCWLTGSDTPQPVELVADVLANSPGPEDQHAVETLGAEEAARRTLALASGFRYLPDLTVIVSWWWRPVCARDSGRRRLTL
jgi:hypothetical protein